MPEVSVWLVDDHAFIREGLKTLINAQPDMKVLGESGDGVDALDAIPRCAPDVVVMDVSMPKMNGTQATVELKRVCPRTKVLVLSMHEDASYLRGLLEAGASGYVLKRSAPQDLVQAVRSVAAGGTYLDPALAGRITAAFVRRPPQHGEIAGLDLSERESDVLRLIARGHTNREIAEQLSVSMKTVETYKARAMEKLSLESRADIVRYASQQGWLQDL